MLDEIYLEGERRYNRMNPVMKGWYFARSGGADRTVTEHLLQEAITFCQLKR